MTAEQQLRALIRVVAALSDRIDALEGRDKPLDIVPVSDALRMRDIADVTAIANMLTVSDLRGKSRIRRVAWPRQDAFRVCHDAGFSTTQIGHFFGGRDHTTVLHGIRASKNRQAPGG